MRVHQLFTALLALGAAHAVPIFRRDVAFDFDNEVVRGVNIGGWLLLEPWITPSIFQAQNGSVVDEWTLCEMVPNAADILQQHWSTWATLADFQKIAAAGFNTIRIPVGCESSENAVATSKEMIADVTSDWAFMLVPGEPYIQGAATYLDQAIGWARQTNLKVWIDLHGAPGSQNGYDNSGHRISKPGWESGSTVQQTLEVIQIMAGKYATPEMQDVVVAIELLNEPLAAELPSVPELISFYEQGYSAVRDVSNTPVMIHDAFEGDGFWNNVLTAPGSQNVVLDHHEYQVFSNEEVALVPWQHRQLVCNNAASYAANQAHWTVVGEWTAAMTDCAAALNGYLIGARYDGTYPGSSFVGSCATINDITTWTETFQNDVRGYIEAQLEVYEQYTKGWVFWNFKTEASPEWDLFRLLDAGIFPQPLTARKFSQICSY
ncbi:exo-1,3-beta-glucanase [Xylographa bjoerkii]|nr:exo-1,3-beta-glucanase [Xylographa bjoerkii]